ncbi:MAG TPA: hypothetical protein VK501_16765 [Baekduia sp.]|uniref:hypothetical protein n=1 Tax=Baekduia sp. TaxID=2600305 RepID=UPI002C3AC636|nr:hypothetical protein [Baekduia sp.]HMJ35563.1 hypothetical protein [Baekduia sp.]
MLVPEMPPAPVSARPPALVATAAADPVRAVGVGAREFSLAVYRPRVRAGRLKLNLRNLGEDVHDLVVRRSGRTLATLAPVKPGGTGILRVALRTPGRYQLVCTVADHAQRGMRATLRVVSSSSGRGPRTHRGVERRVER